MYFVIDPSLLILSVTHVLKYPYHYVYIYPKSSPTKSISPGMSRREYIQDATMCSHLTQIPPNQMWAQINVYLALTHGSQANFARHKFHLMTL